MEEKCAVRAKEEHYDEATTAITAMRTARAPDTWRDEAPFAGCLFGPPDATFAMPVCVPVGWAVVGGLLPIESESEADTLTGGFIQVAFFPMQVVEPDAMVTSSLYPNWPRASSI